MKLFLALITLFSLSISILANPDEKLHEKCLYPVLMISPKNKNSNGTAFVVRSDKISNNLYQNVFITCAHVLDKDVKIYELKYYIYENWSQIKSIQKFESVIYASNNNRDLAIGVFYSDRLMPVSEIDFNAKVYIGSDVYRVGCGFGDEPRLDYGKITSVISQNPTFSNRLRTSVHTVPGDSGSPLFFNYKVIGIMQSIRGYRNTPVFSNSYAIPIYNLKEWSEEYRNNLEFAWNNTKSLPKLPFYFLQFYESHEIIEP